MRDRNPSPSGASGNAEPNIRKHYRRQDPKAKKMNYVADFETTTDPEDCRVWGWGMVALPEGTGWQDLTLEQVDVGTAIDDYLEEVQRLGNTSIYFHNLRFDGRFILDALLKAGYEYNPNKGSLPGTFKSLISDQGQFYSITVKWFSGFVTEFRDSLKKLPMSVATIAKSFDMELGKGDIDYEAPRGMGYQITDEERDYIRRDVWIVARALGQQLANGLNKLTVGADALWEFKQLIGKREYERLFPVFSFSMDAEIRRAYRGGFTYADPRYSGAPQGAGRVYDVNSLYPYVMYDRPIPYGEPEWVPGHPEPTSHRPLTIFSLTFTAKLKPNHIPCIQIKGSSRFVPTEYLTEITEPTTLTVTNVDYALMCEHYDLRVLEWNGGWRFLAANGIFDSYIDKWMRIKAHSTGGMRALSKLQLNSLYGKFATNPDVTGKYPVLDEHGTVQLKGGPLAQRDPVYTPAGVFITSYARDITLRAAQANFDAFAYADTDSLHLLTAEEPTGLRVHPSDLGAWKHEYDFDSAYYIRAKAYLERTADGTYHNAIAGVPVHMSAALRFEDLHPGTEITVTKSGEIIRSASFEHESVMLHGKLAPRAVPGGIVLNNVPYELKL